MKMELNDETLTAYALGELDAGEAKAIEKLLGDAAKAGNAAPRAALEEIRSAAALSRDAFAAEPSGQKLNDDQREGVISLAKEKAKRRGASWQTWRALAAMLLVFVAGAVVVTGLSRESLRESLPALAGMKAKTEPGKLAGALKPAKPLDAPEGQELRYQVAKADDLSTAPASAAPKDEAEPAATPAPKAENTPFFLDKKTVTVVRGATGVVQVLPSPSIAAAPVAGPASSAGRALQQGQGAAGSPGADPRLLAEAPRKEAERKMSLGYAREAERDRLSAIGYGAAKERTRVSSIDSRYDYNYRGQPVQAAEPPSAEAYQRIVDNGFVRVTDQPLSTFSIDVDTASYANVRRFLEQGQLPPVDAVRVEELINYFDYNYPAPADGAPFAVHFEATACPWSPGHALVRIGLKGREVPRAQRPSSNLVFLIDVSGSMMDENKLPLVKRSMAMLTRQLDERDRVSIVTYASGVNLALPVTNAARQDVILSAIERLGAGGSTNGAGGLQLAYQTARVNFLPGGTNRIILATDGDFNVGPSDNQSLFQLIQQETKSGVFLSVFGFGMGNLKDDKLELLADKGNGVYGYIDSESEARKAFVEKLSGTLVTIAKDVKIQVEFNPARVAAYRLIGYENRALAAQDFNDDRKDAGEIGAGHTVTALYEIVPAGKAISIANGMDALRYQSSGGRPTGDTVSLDLGLRNVDEFVKAGQYPEAVAALDVLRNTHLESFDVLSDRMIEVKKAGGLPLSVSEQFRSARLAATPAHADELLLVKLRYKEPAGAESKLIEFPLKNEVAPVPSADLKFASAVAEFGKMLRGAPLGEFLNYNAMLQLAQSGIAASDDPRRAEFVHLMLQARPLIEARYPAGVESRQND